MRIWTSFPPICINSKYLQSNFEVFSAIWFTYFPPTVHCASWEWSFLYLSFFAAGLYWPMLAFVGYHFFAEVLEQPNENTLSTNILLFQPLILFDRDLKDHFDLGFRICPASFKIQVFSETMNSIICNWFFFFLKILNNEVIGKRKCIPVPGKQF